MGRFLDWVAFVIVATVFLGAARLVACGLASFVMWQPTWVPDWGSARAVVVAGLIWGTITFVRDLRGRA